MIDWPWAHSLFKKTGFRLPRFLADRPAQEYELTQSKDSKQNAQELDLMADGNGNSDPRDRKYQYGEEYSPPHCGAQFKLFQRSQS